MERPDVHQSLDSFRDLTTLLEVIYWRTQHQPHQMAYSFLTDGDADSDQMTYAELDQRARAIAVLLQEANASGERVLLLYPPGLDYIAAFFGCLYAGAIAVPAYPPALNRTIPRIQAIVTDSLTSIVLASAHIIASIQRRLDHTPDLRALRWISTDDLPEHSATNWRPPTVAPDSLALLQYTSGSTSTPKGVMLTHRNLLENLRLIERCFEHTPASRGVIWLPPYHDMGLIGGILQPLYAGFPVTLMAPLTFLQSPIRWLRAISQTRATTSGGPNFAYELCASRITAEQRDTLDLSSWDVAFVGAEPIRAQTLERFAAVFEPCGFRRSAFYPCYGLAEATLIVSGGLKAASPVVEAFAADALERHQAVVTSADGQARPIVGCGQAVAEHQIAIVDPQTLQQCSSGTVGEIWVAGASVAQGYWGQPDTTEQIFHARLAETGAGPFLRTGDLGFMRHGELFVTGRLKDLMIIRGKNYYPHDIESTVEQSHPALSVAACAAFSIEVDNQERLVIVQEVERQARKQPLEPIIASIRQAVLEQHQLQAHAVALIRPGRLPKTSSGKIQRYACRQAFLQGTLEALTIDMIAGTTPELEPTGEIQALEQLTPEERQAALESYLQSEVAHVLGMPTAHVDIARPLNSFGLDSMMAVDLQHRVESTLNVVLPLTSFLREISISDLVRSLHNDFADDTPAIEPGLSESGTGEYPLSYGQRALWFLHQLEPTTAAYNIANAVRIRSEVDPAALKRAFERLIERHAALRTTFATRQGEPFQVVHAQGSVDFQVIKAGDSLADLDSQLAVEAQRPFDLERGPLLRVYLFTCSEQEHVLLQVVHHIVADLWSLDILTHELGAIYAAERAGQQIELAPLPLHYPDYVAWQSRALLGSSGTRLWEYWQRQLGDAPLALELPTDHPRPPVQTYVGATQTFRLDQTIAERLKALAQSSEATLYIVLLAAFQVLLYRYTGQTDLLVGSPTTGRSRRALAGMVGYLVNPIILRSNLSGDPTFRTFLGNVRETVLAALEHQEYPLSLLVERLQPERDPSRSPLFQVMFVLQKAHLLDNTGLAMFALGAEGVQMDLGGMTIEALSLKQNIAQFDLTLTMAETDTSLVGAFQYNTALFEPATIERMVGHFQMLVADITARPDQPITELRLMTEAEQQMLSAWNATDARGFSEHTLPELLEAQTARTPDAIAVVFDNQHLTYRELNRRANQLARYLQSLGVRVETRVGICMERSLDLVIGLVGILKAGGAYVPLDPTYPRERLQYMLNDSQTPVLLTQQHLASQLHAEDTEHHAQVVCLDADWPRIARERSEPLAVKLAPLNSAYMIYTSGSTGKPKGAINTHEGICNRLLWMQATYRLNAEDRVLQKTPFSFDVSVWEFFWPLIVGARLVVALPNGHLDPAYLINVINGQQITTLHFVPSMLEVFLEAPKCDTCTSIRRVLCSGEALPLELKERFFTRLYADLHNLYGPTEAAVDVTFWSCAAADGRRSVPIGRPVANTQIYLLDARLNHVPIGVPGELYIGGVQLARGYFNRPDLTAEKFIPDAFSAGYPPGAGARLYRTGDLARYHSDGAIEFLGRIDHQVKLRGFRIELGEIEATLLEHPAIRSCLVLAHANPATGTRLIAYVVPDERYAAQSLPESASQDQESAEALEQAGEEIKFALRRYAQEQLPDYMIPSAFVVLDQMPLLPNGKVDRAALPQPEITRSELEANFVAPRNPVEQKLSEIWVEVLGVKQIGVYDNFFALGGHSLLITQIAARIRNTFKVEVPMRSFFQGPTIAELALLVTQNQVEPPSARTVERLLDQISSLSPEQIRALLAAKQGMNPGAPAAPVAQSAQIEQPVPTPVAAAPVEERYCSVAFTRFSGGDGLELVYPVSGSEPHLLTSDLVTVLERCQQFKTLNDHVQATPGIAEDPQAHAARRRQLEELRSAGLLMRERELCERLAQGATSRQPVQIAAVAWPTCNRVELLQRSLVSYIENCQRYDRTPDFVIMDDSPDPATRRAYQAMLTRVQQQYGAAILYGGLAEKTDFMKHMLATDTLPPEVLDFALFGDPRASHAYGRNINAILLHTTGDAIISADDDTVAQAVPSPEYSDGLGLVSSSSIDGALKLNAGNPDAIWTFPDRETLLRQAQSRATDLLGLHEQLLGQEVRSYTAGVLAAGQPLVLDDAHARLLHSLESRGGHVLITLPGLIGDCGWGTPSHYLSLTGSSLQRLLRSEETYRQACTSRDLLRVAPRVTLVDKVSNMIGATYGLDNREIVPPAVPIAVGQDSVFGDTLAQCYEHSYYAHLPWAVLHLPGDARSFWPGEMLRSASGISFNTLLTALVKRFDPGLSRADGPANLRQLGLYLSELGRLPRHEFAAAIRIAIGQRASLYLQMLQAQLEGPDLPPFWIQDLRQFSTILRESLLKDTFYVPLDLLYGRDIDAAQALTQQFVGSVGQLYAWWPELIRRAKQLRAENLRLAKPVETQLEF